MGTQWGAGPELGLRVGVREEDTGDAGGDTPVLREFLVGETPAPEKRSRNEL